MLCQCCGECGNVVGNVASDHITPLLVFPLASHSASGLLRGLTFDFNILQYTSTVS